MEINLTISNFSHYTVFYLPVRDPYGPIMTSSRRKRQLTQTEESMNFTGTTGTLTGLYGAVTYRIQVAVVGILNGQEITGDRSAADEVTTREGGKQIVLVHHTQLYQWYINIVVPTFSCELSIMILNNDVTLTWRRPDPPNGLITQYRVRDIPIATDYDKCLLFIGVLY